MPHTDEKLSLKLFVVLSKAYKSLMEAATKDIRTYGLSASEFAIMEALYSKGRYPIQQIGEAILLTSGSMTYNIDKLENKGLLRRVLCQEDRRVIYVEMTEDGRRLFDDIFPKHTVYMHNAMSGLSSEQKLEAIRLLKMLGKQKPG